jgi:hypothetical protein
MEIDVQLHEIGAANLVYRTQVAPPLLHPVEQRVLPTLPREDAQDQQMRRCGWCRCRAKSPGLCVGGDTRPGKRNDDDWAHLCAEAAAVAPITITAPPAPAPRMRLATTC